jgi:RNA polymerase sigma factor (sigma-70 family)
VALPDRTQRRARGAAAPSCLCRARREHEPASADESSELRATLLEALGDLPERQRAAYLLREVQGLRIAEIGEALELTIQQVEQALFAARNRLAEQLTFGAGSTARPCRS